MRAFPWNRSCLKITTGARPQRGPRCTLPALCVRAHWRACRCLKTPSDERGESKEQDAGAGEKDSKSKMKGLKTSRKTLTRMP